MKKSFIFLLHTGFWVCYFTLVFIVLGIYSRSMHTAGDQQFRMINALKSIMLFAFIPSVTCYVLFSVFLFPRYLQQKKYLLSIFFGILISAATAVAGYIFLRFCIESGFVMDMDEGGKNGRSTAPRVILVMTGIGLICGIVSLVIKGFITWFNEIKMKEMLTAKNYEMEMALIKAQLDPHLFFNTINNIDALILKDAAVASDYLNKLSDILRFILYETKTETIFLSREIEFIDKYIALQKIRTANASYVQFTVTGNAGSIRVAPMVFMPIIENAFKHTNNKKRENAILINMIIQDETIQLLCENKFDMKINDPKPDSGLGNTLIQKRLNLLYAGTHQFEVDRTQDLYRVHLTIPHG